MTRWWVLGVAALLAMVVLMPQGIRAVTPSASPQEQVYGLATQHATLSGTYWQNGSLQYQSGASPWTFSVAFTNYTSLTYSSFSLTTTLGSALEPTVNITSGPTTLLNGTGPGTFTIFPPNGTRSLGIHVPTAYEPGGGTPPTGKYALLYAGQFVTEYQTLHASTWTISGTTESESFVLSSPAGAWLNQTTIFLPFPLPVSVNYTSVAVTVGGAPYAYFQTAADGVYVSDPSLGPSSDITFVASFVVAPSVGGPAPVLVIKNFSTVSNGVQSYVATATWINRLYPLWGGDYFLELDIGYAIDDSSLNISVNGHTFVKAAYLASGNTLVILPLNWYTPMNGTDSFKVLFNIPSVSMLTPPTTSTGLDVFGVIITFGDFLIFVMAVGLVALAVLWAPRFEETLEGRIRKNPASPERWRATYAFVILVLLSAIGYGALR